MREALGRIAPGRHDHLTDALEDEQRARCWPTSMRNVVFEDSILVYNDRSYRTLLTIASGDGRDGRAPVYRIRIRTGGAILGRFPLFCACSGRAPEPAVALLVCRT